MRVVLIAADLADGSAYRCGLPATVEVVVTVTPRIMAAARGHTADELVWTPAASRLPLRLRNRLLAECVPAIYAGQAARS